MGANAPSKADRMRAQGYTEEEIEDMLKCDKEIDQGVDLSPLTLRLSLEQRKQDEQTEPTHRRKPIESAKRTLKSANLFC